MRQRAPVDLALVRDGSTAYRLDVIVNGDTRVAPKRGKSDTSLPHFTKPPTWLGAPFGAPTTATKAAIVGIPFDCGTHPNRIGSRMGPAAIREMSTHLRRYDPRSNLDVVADLGLIDCGDVPVTSSLIEESFSVIEVAITAIASKGTIPITMGGDGAVTLPQVRALARLYPGLCIVHIDAHTDAYPIQGYNTATGFRHMAQEGLIDAKRSFQIGMRGPTMVPGVFEFCRELGYNLITMAEDSGLCVDALEGRPGIHSARWAMVDPSVAPGVCTPTWGGCLAHEGLAFLELLQPLDTKLLDVNTVSPPHDTGGMTAFLAGTLMWTFLAGLAEKKI